MPRKITSITIDNYRAWYGLYSPIFLPKGENLLIYGENGSGKSSFFKSLQNFFRSSVSGDPAFELNVFSVLAGNTNGVLTVEFTDLPPDVASVNSYIYSTPTPSTNNQPFINDTRKLNSFLDYKKMLGLHFTDPESQSTPDLFELLIEGLLGDYIIPSTGRTVNAEIQTITEGLSRRSDSWMYQEAVANVPIIQAAIQVIITDVLIGLNQLLNEYFDDTLEVLLFEYHFDIYPTYRKYLIKRFKIHVNYSGRVINSYNGFLNEARLSSMAICFYLAAVLSHPPAGTSYKILFLDDIFIGLDMSNRVPLLEVINNEFSDFQCFITTYDRNWFETSKHWFEFNSIGKWKNLEIYVNDQLHAFEIPLLITETDNIKLAEQYFFKKDYPAAANALRRECEELLKRILPDEMRFSADPNTGVTFEIIQLETLYGNLVKFLEANQIDASFIKEFKFFQKNIFNPLSHGDITVPHYRQEISAAIDFVKNLRKIKVKKIISVSPESYGILCLDTKHNLTWQTQHYEISCLDNVYAIQFDTNPVVLTNPRCNLFHHETTTHWYYFDHQDLDLKSIFKTVWRLCKYPNEADLRLMFQWISNKDGVKLNDLMIF